MNSNYQCQVVETTHDYQPSEQECVGVQIDKSLQCPYTAHIIVGRNTSDELLFVSYDRTMSDGRLALQQACGVYYCKVGHWPDFFVARGEVRKICVVGVASAECLTYLKHRRMIVIRESDMKLGDAIGRSSSDPLQRGHRDTKYESSVDADLSR